MKLLVHVFIYFGILSLAIYASLLIKPRIWLHRMPPEVRIKTQSKTQQEKKWFAVLGIPLGFVFFFYPAMITTSLYNQFDHIVLSLFVFTAGFALWDTLILDLLIFCKITPKRMIIPGTSMYDYKNKKYHLTSGYRGLIIASLYSLIVGNIISVIF